MCAWRVAQTRNFTLKQSSTRSMSANHHLSRPRLVCSLLHSLPHASIRKLKRNDDDEGWYIETVPRGFQIFQLRDNSIRSRVNSTRIRLHLRAPRTYGASNAREIREGLRERKRMKEDGRSARVLLVTRSRVRFQHFKLRISSEIVD